MPEHFRLPLMIVVHMPPDKESILADLFRARCRIQVREDEDKEPSESSNPKSELSLLRLRRRRGGLLAATPEW